MKESTTQYRNHNLGVRVTAHQKTEYQQIATSYNYSTSEWAAIIIECFKHSLPELNKPSTKEQQLEEENDELKKQIIVAQELLNLSKEENSKFQKEVKELNKTLAEYEVSIKDLTTKYRDQQTETNHLKEEIKTKNDEVHKIAKGLNEFNYAEQAVQRQLLRITIK